MAGPARKREAVGHLQRELRLSQRRACKVVGLAKPKSTHSTKSKVAYLLKSYPCDRALVTSKQKNLGVRFRGIFGWCIFFKKTLAVKQMSANLSSFF